MTTVHNLTTRKSHTFSDDPEFWEAVETLRIGYDRYSVGGWTKDTAHRIAFGGNKIAGPVAFANAHATVISAHHIPDTNTYLDVKLGDLVSVAGSVYQIESAPNRNIALVRVLGDEPGCGKNCACHIGASNCWHADPNTSKPVFERCDCEA